MHWLVAKHGGRRVEQLRKVGIHVVHGEHVPHERAPREGNLLSSLWVRLRPVDRVHEQVAHRALGALLHCACLVRRSLGRRCKRRQLDGEVVDAWSKEPREDVVLHSPWCEPGARMMYLYAQCSSVE